MEYAATPITNISTRTYDGALYASHPGYVPIIALHRNPIVKSDSGTLITSEINTTIAVAATYSLILSLIHISEPTRP